jgi:hypothetical protein
VDPTGRRLFGVAAAFVAVAGLVWCVLSILLAVASVGVAPALAADVGRVGGPPAVVAVVAGAVALWARR